MSCTGSGSRSGGGGDGGVDPPADSDRDTTPIEGGGGLGGLDRIWEPREFETFVLDSPCPQVDARFGFSLVPLDFDGDGVLDFAGGAPGVGAVHVLFGGSSPAWSDAWTLDATGRADCDRPPTEDRFGTALAAGDLDGDGDDELVVGSIFGGERYDGVHFAGTVHVFGIAGRSAPLVLEPGTEVEEYFGQSVVVEDFDLDGRPDIAVGAVHALSDDVDCGRVRLYLDPLADDPIVVELPNPHPTSGGHFGLHLAVDDMDHDGFRDLIVSGIFNDSENGVVNGGRVYCYWGVPEEDRWLAVEDEFPLFGDLPRFGMHLAARGGLLSVGAPRKDIDSVVDAGLGESFSGPGLLRARAFAHPHPNPRDLFGYRTVVGDYFGSPALDIGFVCLPDNQHPEPNPLAFYLFDGDDPEAPPFELLAPPDSGDHFMMGSASFDLDGDGRDDIVAGDARYDRPGLGHLDNVGRLVIYH